MIASDKSGENLAFGTAVPFPTTRSSKSQLRDDIYTIVSKMSAHHKEHIKSLPQEDKDAAVISVPIPVYPSESDTINTLQTTAIMCASIAVEALDAEGFTVMSCTPAVMGDESFEDAPEGVAPGYVIYAALVNTADKIMDGFGNYRVAGAWTHQADEIYGQSAVEKFRENQSASLEALLNQLNGEKMQ